VREPEALPFNLPHLEGYPATISEIGWPNPNRFRADFPFLAAAYGALTGLDGICYFAVSGPSWATGLQKFPADVPTVRGQFPALALLYRQGYVQEDTAGVVRETLALESLYDFGGAALVAPPALDQLRARDQPADRGEEDQPRVDPLAFLAGQVIREFGTRPALRTRRLDRLIDRRRQVVRSVTGEHRYDYGRGVVTLDAPCAQGATGFLGEAGAIELSAVTVECGNEYATVVVVSLDGKPLRRSDRILVQAVTEEMPYGFATEGDRIVALGGVPLLVRELEATMRLCGGARLRTARVLDPDGCERERLEPRATGRDLVLTLPRDAFWVVLE
jgi:hypothetical protein